MEDRNHFARRNNDSIVALAPDRMQLEPSLGQGGKTIRDLSAHSIPDMIDISPGFPIKPLGNHIAHIDA